MEIYLDHAATTYIKPEVLKAMLPYFSENFGNPNSPHSPGLKAKQAVDQARKTIAGILNCQANEIIFTGSGTEANNIALIGSARARMHSMSAQQAKNLALPVLSEASLRNKNHIITTKIEHESVLKPLEFLEKNEGFHITYLDVNNKGLINLDEFEKSINNDTILASIIYANNEIGTIQDIKKIAAICKKHDILLHIDACQASCYLSLDTKKLGVDLMTINGSKSYGPKGIGALYIKEGTAINAIIHGGGQEKGLRSGTLNTPSIIGLAKALELAEKNKTTESERIRGLRNKLIDGILKNIKGASLNGDKEQRLPNNANLQIPGINGKELILHLDAAGIYGSNNSACSTNKKQTSQVLSAIGLSEDEANSSIRLTLGARNTEKDIEYCIETLSKIAEKLR